MLVLKKVKSVASRAYWKALGEVKSVASRACWKQCEQDFFYSPHLTPPHTNYTSYRCIWRYIMLIWIHIHIYKNINRQIIKLYHDISCVPKSFQAKSNGSSWENLASLMERTTWQGEKPWESMGHAANFHNLSLAKLQIWRNIRLNSNPGCSA